MSHKPDICLISEGSYPYSQGGVASWVHDMVNEMKEYKFHIVSLVAPKQQHHACYALPSNVVGHDTFLLGALPAGSASLYVSEEMHVRLRPLLTGLLEGVPLDSAGFGLLLNIFDTYQDAIGSRMMLDDKAAWETLLATYYAGYEHLSFLDFFWSYRTVLAALASTLTFPLPPARLYHSISTGYAGLLGARTKHKSDAPYIITEHGIYTNERRIEILAADWLQKQRTGVLSVDNIGVDLRDLWVRYFESMARSAYSSADRIVSLFDGCQLIQHTDGAAVEKTQIIPNGIDAERFASLPRMAHQIPTIAFIGRVVPIKDVKSFIHAIANVAQQLPQIHALIIGPMDEDPAYAKECQQLVEALGLTAIVKFTGMVAVEQFLPTIDLVVLTSISEAQPLALLEAGAAGIPLIATDVGACRQIIYGMPDETPALGDGGIVTALANPQATSNAIVELLNNRPRYAAAATAIRRRVHNVYRKQSQFASYRNLYQTYLR